MQQRKKRRGMLGTLLLTAILVTAVFAYTNSISGLNPPAVAAEASVVDGFAASNIAWVSAAGRTVDGVTFDLAPTPSVVRVSLNNGVTWRTCAAGATVNCTFLVGVDAASIMSLDVYAAE